MLQKCHLLDGRRTELLWGGAPFAGVELFAGPFGEGRRVAHRLICMVSLVILKCMNLVIQLANDNKVN